MRSKLMAWRFNGRRAIRQAKLRNKLQSLEQRGMRASVMGWGFVNPGPLLALSLRGHFRSNAVPVVRAGKPVHAVSATIQHGVSNRSREFRNVETPRVSAGKPVHAVSATIQHGVSN